MRIYLAGERAKGLFGLEFRGGCPYREMMDRVMKRRLFSFYYHGYSRGDHAFCGGFTDGLSNDIRASHELGKDLFLDSGAFTAFTKKKNIDPTEYAEYVKRTLKLWSTCSSLDAIGSGMEAARASYRNFKKLRDLGASVQPVFHVREPNKALQYYVDAGWDYIFIGGMVPETTEWLMVRLDELWGKILTDKDGRARVKVHGFGLTDQQLMFRYPWYSVDSSSWLMTGVFGACLFRVNNKLRKVVFSDESPEARKFRGWHYRNLPAETRAIVDGWLEPFGITAEQLGSHYSYRDVINAAVFQGLEDLGNEVFVPQQQVLFEEVI